MAEMTQMRMSVEEFLQLPETMQKMELINGEIIIAPAPVPQHQRILRLFVLYLDSILDSGEVVVSPQDVVLSGQTVQPDIFWIREGGDCVIVDKHWEGAPDLVIEILSPSTAKYDRGAKFDIYETSGVHEYWLADPEGLFAEIYVLKNEKFNRLGVFDGATSFQSAALKQTMTLKSVFGEAIGDDKDGA